MKTSRLRSSFYKTLQVDGRTYGFYDLEELEKAAGLAAEDPTAAGPTLDAVPFSMRVILENLLRNEHADIETIDLALDILSNGVGFSAKEGIPFKVSRIVAQDVSGIPALIDLAAMRELLSRAGGDPEQINPLVPVDLVVDHSLEVDHAGSAGSLDLNVRLEYQRNRERYEFLKWAQSSMRNLKVVPPGYGILHQINLEYLARVVFVDDSQTPPLIYPDSLIGTDSHTAMINGLGVFGWGVGGIEVEAALLGASLLFPSPRIVGVRLINEPGPGVSSTDIVLTLTKLLRGHGVIDSFVEFTGPALDTPCLTLEDRATIANMCPEYGSTMGFFPIDEVTLSYLRKTGRSEHTLSLIRAYCKAQKLWREKDSIEPNFSDLLEFDLSSVQPSASGPRRPHERVSLSHVPTAFLSACEGVSDSPGRDYELAGLDHGAVIIAAITSCTSTSNPRAIIAAALLAKKAYYLGLTPRSWVKTSFSPGSTVVADYLKASGLLTYLEKLGFYIVGYGCASCGGGSGPIDNSVQDLIKSKGLIVSAVLSGNRNFEGRIHPHARANFLVSPALVVAYAITGTVRVDLTEKEIGQSTEGKSVYLSDIWPSNAEIAAVEEAFVTPESFKRGDFNSADKDQYWAGVPSKAGVLYDWSPTSTYVCMPTYLERRTKNFGESLVNARPLLILGDSVTTDNISPADGISAESLAGQYLISKGVSPRALHTFISRRGNQEVMVRSAFTGGFLANEMLKNGPAGHTLTHPSGAIASIYDAAMSYLERGVPAIVVAGKEYGTGSSRDWAAKATRLLGVQAVLAESFERIHRSNLVHMGVLPLQFEPGVTRHSLGICADTTISVDVPEDLTPGALLVCRIHNPNGTLEFRAQARVDTSHEVRIWKNDGILPVLYDELTA